MSDINLYGGILVLFSCTIPVTCKWALWLVSRPAPPAVGQVWAYPGISPRWPPHRYEIIEISDGRVIYLSHWAEGNPDTLFKTIDTWDDWRRKRLLFLLDWKTNPAT